MPMLNPMHLDHANMQQVVPSGDERWDEIWNVIKFDQALNKNQVEEVWILLRTLRMSLLGTKGNWGAAQQENMQLTPKAFPHVAPHLGDYLIRKKLK